MSNNVVIMSIRVRQEVNNVLLKSNEWALATLFISNTTHFQVKLIFNGGQKSNEDRYKNRYKNMINYSSE